MHTILFNDEISMSPYITLIRPEQHKILASSAWSHRCSQQPGSSQPALLTRKMLMLWSDWWKADERFTRTLLGFFFWCLSNHIYSPGTYATYENVVFCNKKASRIKLQAVPVKLTQGKTALDPEVAQVWKWCATGKRSIHRLAFSRKARWRSLKIEPSWT